MHRIAFIIAMAALSGCASLPAAQSGHTVVPAIHRQQTPGNAIEHAAAPPFAGHGERYIDLAHGAYGNVPQAGLFNRKFPPDRAAHGSLRDLLITFDCDYSNSAPRFSPAAVYVQLKALNDYPRGEDYRRWVFRDFVVRGVCERALTATKD